MIAGVLVSVVLVFLVCPQGPSGSLARAVAWGTIAMGFGGSMTYGQTIGLTHRCYEQPVVAPELGWFLFLILPLAVTTKLALDLGRVTVNPSRSWLGKVLLLNTWLYFGLNFAFFRFPWPRQAWTSRSPNAFVFLVFALGLTFLALSQRRRR